MNENELIKKIDEIISNLTNLRDSIIETIRQNKSLTIQLGEFNKYPADVLSNLSEIISKSQKFDKLKGVLNLD